MPALIIGDDERAMIGALRARMAANPINPAEANAAAKADPAAFRRHMSAFTIELPIGYFVTYSVERQPAAPPPGLCTHISISVARARMMPSTAAVDMILEAFGMSAIRAGTSKIWIEQIDEWTKAVNVVQLL
jgi:hypothetical protein